MLKDVEIIFRTGVLYLVEINEFMYDNYGFALISLSDQCIFRCILSSVGIETFWLKLRNLLFQII